MHIVDLETFKSEYRPKWNKTKRLLGIDLGKKRIGLALSDPSLTIATPYRVLTRSTFQRVLENLLDIIEREEIGGLVMGLPIETDGHHGRAVQGVKHFVYNLSPHMDLPLVYWDERLSTVAVQRILTQSSLTQEKKTHVIDKMAASYILQGFLEALAFTNSSNVC